MSEALGQRLRDHILQNAQQMTREPEGVLTHPYTVPSSPNSPYYSDALWDWDSWFISVVLGQVELDLGQPGRFAAYEQGNILNFLDHTDGDGVMPIRLNPAGAMLHRDDGSAAGFTENMHKPVIAQQAALLALRKRRCSGELVRLNGVAGASVRG